MPDQARRPTTRTFVWMVWTALLGLQVAAFVRFGIDVPLVDDWDLLELTVSDWNVRLQSIWHPGNMVHRLPLPKLLFIGLGEWTGWDFRAPMVFNLVCMALLSAVLIRTARRVRGHASIVDTTFPLLFMGGGMVHHVLFGFQMTFMCGSLILGLILAWLIGSKRASGRGSSFALVLGVVALPLCGANGLLASAPLAVWMLARGISSLRRGSDEPTAQGRFEAWVYIAGALLTFALCAAYLVGLEPGGRDDFRARSHTGAVLTSIRFLSTAVGSCTRRMWPWSGVGIVFVLVALGALVAHRAMRDRPDRWRALGILALGAAWLLMSAAVGFGRGGAAALAGFGDRYTLLTAPLGAAIALVPLWLARSSSVPALVRPFVRGAPWVLLAVLTVFFPYSLQRGEMWAQKVYAARSGFDTTIRKANWLDYRLVQAQVLRDYTGGHDRIHHRPSAVARSTFLLELHRAGPFGRRRVPPPPTNLLVLLETRGRDRAPEPPAQLASWGVAFAHATLTQKDRTWLQASAAFPRRVDWSSADTAEAELEALASEGELPFAVAASVTPESRDAAIEAALLHFHNGARPDGTLILWIDVTPEARASPALIAAWNRVIDGGLVDDRALKVGPTLRRVLARWSAVRRNRWSRH